MKMNGGGIFVAPARSGFKGVKRLRVLKKREEEAAFCFSGGKRISLHTSGGVETWLRSIWLRRVQHRGCETGIN